MPKFRDDDIIKVPVKKEKSDLAAGVPETVQEAVSVLSVKENPEGSGGVSAPVSEKREYSPEVSAGRPVRKRSQSPVVRVRDDMYRLMNSYNDFLEGRGESRLSYVDILEFALKFTFRKQGKELRKFLEERGQKI